MNVSGPNDLLGLRGSGSDCLPEERWSATLAFSFQNLHLERITEIGSILAGKTIIANASSQSLPGFETLESGGSGGAFDSKAALEGFAR